MFNFLNSLVEFSPLQNDMLKTLGKLTISTYKQIKDHDFKALFKKGHDLESITRLTSAKAFINNLVGKVTRYVMNVNTGHVKTTWGIGEI